MKDLMDEIFNAGKQDEQNGKRGLQKISMVTKRTIDQIRQRITEQMTKIRKMIFK